jgi:hypothetical protein
VAARASTSLLAPVLLAALLQPLAAIRVESSPGLRWEPVPAAPATVPAGSPAPVDPSAGAAPTARAAGLRWEPVPVLEPGLAFTAADGALAAPPAASAGLAWGLVPESEVITAAMVAASAPPEPPYLPETWPPPVPVLRNLGRGITVNGEAYPDTGMMVPNGFAADPDYTVTTSMLGISRTRSCRVPPDGRWLDCADLEAHIDIVPFRWDTASLGFRWTVQSLSSRNGGTGQFSAQSLGFRTAINLTPTTGLAFGGEHVLQLDSNTDLGRNFYLVLSQAVPLSRGADPALAVATVGIGSDFYGYGSNGTLGSTDCLSGNNISSRNFPEGTDCYWGPIGSLSLQLGPRVALGAEWFGYGVGAGVSVRPLREIPLTLSFYLTDFLGNIPEGIETLCTDDPCQPRLYGRITMSF